MSSCFPLACVNTGLDTGCWEKMLFITKTFVRMQILVSVSFCLLLVKRKLLKALNVLLRWDQANKPTHTHTHAYAVHKCLISLPFSVFLCGLHTETRTHKAHASHHLHKSNYTHLPLNVSHASRNKSLRVPAVSDSVVAQSHVRTCFVSHPHSGLSVCTFHNFFFMCEIKITASLSQTDRQFLLEYKGDWGKLSHFFCERNIR